MVDGVVVVGEEVRDYSLDAPRFVMQLKSVRGHPEVQSGPKAEAVAASPDDSHFELLGRNGPQRPDPDQFGELALLARNGG